ncbi:Hypothetical predicted protein [Olea europaea subsp. europaea]|uniref:Uncharacterized protein n=1 Tax=Olea europaea subsp. europaea TaxID=158383 RepID=A0A8S0SBK2_OLEEU|nr:Hypothetical predicted protein [Olea europaea subsp. europaea]
MNHQGTSTHLSENESFQSDSMDEAASNSIGGDLHDRNYKQTDNFSDLQYNNIQRQLTDAQSLIESMKLEQFHLIEEIEFLRADNHRLTEMLYNKEMAEQESDDHNKKSSGTENQESTLVMKIIEDTNMMDLQAKLEKLSRNLKETQLLNSQYLEDHASRFSKDHQIDLIRSEVETETTKTIFHLQEEVDRLQSECHVRICSMDEENLNLRNSLAAKEDEIRALCAEWERETLELTTFLIDGSKSLGDASRQMKSISRTFPHVNIWIDEHVERAVKICIEKEEKILLLQESLEDAQKTVMQMEQQLISLKGATIALTEFQQLENNSSNKEDVQLTTLLNDSFDEKEFSGDKLISKDRHSSEAETCSNAALVVENRTANYFMSGLKDSVNRDVPFAHTKGLTMANVDDQIELARLVLLEIEDAVNAAHSDAETYLYELKSDIHKAVSLYKELISESVKDIAKMRRNVEEFNRNQGSLQLCAAGIPSSASCMHENQLQMLQEIRDELVETNDRLSSITVGFYKVMNVLNPGSTEDLVEIDGWISDCSTSDSDSSDYNVDQDNISNKSSSRNSYDSPGKITEQILSPESDEGSNFNHNTTVLHFGKELRKARNTFAKLKDQFIEVLNKDTIKNVPATNSSLPDMNEFVDFIKHHVLGHNQPAMLETNHKVQHDKLSMLKAESGRNYSEQSAVEDKFSNANTFFAKFEEAHSTVKEADHMLKAMLKANENANLLMAIWKQAGEELMADKANLSEEIKQLRLHIHLRDGENEVLQDHIHYGLREIGNLMHLLEGSFLQMQRSVEELLNAAYDNAFYSVQETLNLNCNLRFSLEDVMCRTVENEITSIVLQCHMGEFFHKFRRLNITSNLHTSPFQEDCLTMIDLERGYVRCNNASIVSSAQWQGDQTAKLSKREVTELALVQDDTISENYELKRELERKDVLLKGLFFDFSLLQESLCNRKDSKDEIEELVVTLNRVKHELQLKTVQLDDMLSENIKLEVRLTEAEQALCISKSGLEKARGKLDFLSAQNTELQVLTKDLYLKKSEAEELLEDQREIVRSLEKESIHMHLSSQKQSISSMKDIEEDLRRVSLERDELVEQLCSWQDRLDMACSLADQNEAIAAEARQESEVSKMYAEQKEEEVKILENSVAELDITITVLEKKVQEMGEEIEKHRVIRDSLELELQGLRERLLTVEDLTETLNSDNSSTTLSEDLISRKLHSRSLELAEALRRIRVLEAEKAGQSKEIEQIKEYISELVLHSEAQASQYQQKYKNLETMVREVKTDVSSVTFEAAASHKEDKSSTRTRRSSSPFRCIASLVQQMNVEKDQEMLNARLRIKELEALSASRQKEVCMLNTKLAATESMTHDVIRDLLSVKLDITNYANMIDQNQLQKLVEEALQQRQELITMEHEIYNLRGQINDLLEERERCISEVNRSKTDLLTTQITVEELQERDQLLTAQNNMLKVPLKQSISHNYENILEFDQKTFFLPFYHALCRGIKPIYRKVLLS